MSALLCLCCCGWAAEPVEACTEPVLVLLPAPGAFGGSSCQGASMGPASLLAWLADWLAYTTIPSLTFYYDGWKDLPKINCFKGKAKKKREQYET